MLMGYENTKLFGILLTIHLFLQPDAIVPPVFQESQGSTGRSETRDQIHLTR